MSAVQSPPEILAIRPIESGDNAALEALVIATLAEFGFVGPGFASSDPELKDLYANFHTSSDETPDKAYWVIFDQQTKRVLGGGGFSRLKGTTPEEGICELQKLYFSPELRGKGFGQKMLTLCIDEARRAGYRKMYLETTHQMTSAVRLYEKFGFQHRSTRMGNTGHHRCTVFMSRPL